MEGQTIWIIDENRRVYEDDDGNKIDRPNLRHKFVPVECIKETRQNYIIERYGRQQRIAKDHAFLNLQQIEDYIYCDRNRWKLSDRVRDCRDAAKLRQIAAILDA